MFNELKIVVGSVAVFSLLSCNNDSINSQLISYPAKATVAKQEVMFTTSSGVKVYNGGFGSSMTSNKEGLYYIMTDRGPNIEGNTNEKIFSNPTFNPQIGMFQLEGESLVFKSLISLQDETGKPLTGLPNPQGAGGTGEIPLDIDKKVLGTDPKGIDPEGLVIANDGTFWVSDEYGPHIIRFDGNGRTIERINPFGDGLGGRKIPSVFAKRRANRGMEGLTITPDQKFIVGMMQSPLFNPDSKVKATATTLRILFFEIATGKSNEYLYHLDNVETAVSEITAISNTTFLVLERDGLLPGKDANCNKKLYKIDISNATDVSTSDVNGKMINNKTIEQSTPSELVTAGIKVVSKELAFDIMSIANYPHDKPEGVVIINKNLIAIINDDDFGIGGIGNYETKIMPNLGNIPDKNIIYYVTPLKPLQ